MALTHNESDIPQPFRINEIVISVDALSGSYIKNGLLYTVYSCELRINPANGLGPFWYVGVEREDYKSHDWLTPRLFRSIEQPKLMIFEHISQECPIYAN